MSRIAIVKKERCKGGIDCPYICANACPVNRSGKECIRIEEKTRKIVIDEELCIGCGICIKKCPYEAIDIINLPEKLSKNPVHRYGRNGFHLYNIPIPIFGKVVGIVGKNGIGKSTALNILSGNITPNLGEEKEASYKEIIEFFKGTEAQLFFEKLKQGEIKVSFKPQAVELITKKFEGKVRDLLKKVDEKNIIDEVTKSLNLEDVLDTDIKNISGGELQRVAIAATVMKKANFYIFDEPTSYLDIKQRINVSNFIKKLANEDIAVMVVEHDLIILDYMADLIHIIYGKEGSYGIVSQPKSVKNGINVYLEGYLKEENIRFRDKALKFFARPPVEKRKEIVLTSWSDIRKKLENFELEVASGEIKKPEIIGIVGENGIGKTTFVKILAGIIKSDSGEVKEKIKISYKPQYISRDSEELVLNVLKEAISQYEILLIRPLELKNLFLKKINELSGGELQRVAIAECLAKDADLYLLDEPSAYLDVEQRLTVSKVIKEVIENRSKSCLVVDHDLLFI
ncbi:MAG: ribosome biogenesis/translation initiation ATPase RLI, partial [Candidatus Woesearchaeota archaeon]